MMVQYRYSTVLVQALTSLSPRSQLWYGTALMYSALNMHFYLAHRDHCGAPCAIHRPAPHHVLASAETSTQHRQVALANASAGASSKQHVAPAMHLLGTVLTYDPACSTREGYKSNSAVLWPVQTAPLVGQQQPGIMRSTVPSDGWCSCCAVASQTTERGDA
jgi:hypothetical protein